MEGEVKGKTFKMKGHTLPGINQKIDAKATNVAEQGLAGSSALQQVLPPGGVQPITQGVGEIGGIGDISQAIQQRNPSGGTVTNPSSSALSGVFRSKPSIAKDKAYRNPGRPENKAHNAKPETEQHGGYPHDQNNPPKPAAPKSKPSIAKRYKKTEGESTMGSYPSMKRIKKQLNN